MHATRALAMREVERRIFALYRATNRDSKGPKCLHGNWWFYVRSNWNAVCHANVVRAALALVEDRQDRAAFVEAAERGMRYFLESFLEDGYCTEGAGYWNYGFGHYLELAKAVKVATGGFVDLTRLPRAREAMEYGFGYRLVGERSPVFADGGGGAPSANLLKLGRELFGESLEFRVKSLELGVNSQTQNSKLGTQNSQLSTLNFPPAPASLSRRCTSCGRNGLRSA